MVKNLKNTDFNALELIFFIYLYYMKTNNEDIKSTTESASSRWTAAKIMRAVFGIIMIIIYFGMGYLMLANFFEVPHYVSLTLGIVFIAYGIFRGYRQYKGIDYTYRRD